MPNDIQSYVKLATLQFCYSRDNSISVCSVSCLQHQPPSSLYVLLHDSICAVSIALRLLCTGVPEGGLEMGFMLFEAYFKQCYQFKTK